LIGKASREKKRRTVVGRIATDVGGPLLVDADVAARAGTVSLARRKV
jgi:hypothetical protein